MNKEKHPHKYRLEQKKKAQKAARKGSQNESAFLNQVQALRNKSGQNPWTEAASQK